METKEAGFRVSSLWTLIAGNNEQAAALRKELGLGFSVRPKAYHVILISFLVERKIDELFLRKGPFVALPQGLSEMEEIEYTLTRCPLSFQDFQGSLSFIEVDAKRFEGILKEMQSLGIVDYRTTMVGSREKTYWLKIQDNLFHRLIQENVGARLIGDIQISDLKQTSATFALVNVSEVVRRYALFFDEVNVKAAMELTNLGSTLPGWRENALELVARMNEFVALLDRIQEVIRQPGGALAAKPMFQEPTGT